MRRERNWARDSAIGAGLFGAALNGRAKESPGQRAQLRPVPGFSEWEEGVFSMAAFLDRLLMRGWARESLEAREHWSPTYYLRQLRRFCRGQHGRIGAD